MSVASIERRVVTVAAVNTFIVILNVVVVLVIGPDIVAGLGIPGSDLGLVHGAYAATATASCLAGTFLFDRVGRRTLMVALMGGLTVGLAATAIAPGRTGLLAARAFCGLFGVAAGATALAIIADVVPPERRGRATGAVLSAASLVTVFGDPAALELSRRLGWRSVFFAAAAACLLTAIGTLALLPPLREHLAERERPRFPPLRPSIRWTYGAALLVMVPTFLIAPNITNFLLHNLGCPRARLAPIYLASGVAGFIAQRGAGRLIDKLGAVRVDAANTALYCAVVAAGFAWPVLSPAALAVIYEVAVLTRQLPYQTLASMAPTSPERGRFNAFRSALHQGGAAAGAVVGSRMLRTLPDQRLDGVPRLAVAAMVGAAILPLLLARIARLIDRERAAAAIAKPAA